MKINTLILFASLAVLTSSVSAASNQTEPDLVVLPTFAVKSSRYHPAEQRIKASLNELSRQASAETIISAEMPGLKAQVVRNISVVQAGQAASPHVLAKS